jgi:Amt family ammonium transporter
MSISRGKFLVGPATGILTAVAFATAAWAQTQEAAPAAPTLDKGDTAWMLTSTAIVLMMTVPGLALFYGGMVRKMNVLATLMQSFACACLISIVWLVIGYSLAFTEGSALIGGLSRVMMSGVELGTLSGTMPETVFMTFQMTFAMITPALILGAAADRLKFSAMLLFVALWSVLVYSPVAHWVWGPGGFLGGVGIKDYAGFLGLGAVLDFAGGTVVHIISGVSALVLCLVLGKRKGYGTEPMPPHNLVLTLIGASLLWVGWFGFNAGSAVAADGRAGMAMLATQVAAAAAGLAWMFCEWGLRGKPSLLGIASGAIAGLVCITPAAGFVTPGGALIMGLVGGAVCFWASTILKNQLGYDDSLDVFGIHGVGGITGAILTGVFAAKDIGGTPGLLEGAPMQVVSQIAGVLVTAIFAAVVTFILLKVVDVIVGLRVDQQDEVEGLDRALHGEVVP